MNDDRESVGPKSPVDSAARTEAQLPAHTVDLPPCHSRRDFDSKAGVYFCAHPRVHVAGDLVTSDVCRNCRYWQQPPPERFRAFPSGAGRYQAGPCLHLGEQTGLRDCPTCSGHVQLKVFACHHPEHDPTTLDECRFCPDYEPHLARGTVRRWAVGVTTAPRTKPTLQRCLASLIRAGWDSVRIFAEPLTPIPRSVAQQPITWRQSGVGAWPNWYLALAELYQREPLADAYLMVQDDAVFCLGVREYLESALWPQPRLAYVALYNPLLGIPDGPAFEPVVAGRLLPGAVALVFPNVAARLLLADSQVLLHRRSGPTAGLAHVDAVVSQWAKRCGLAELLHAPSLVQHVGDATTIGPAGQDQHRRESATFVGETFDVRQWIPASTPSTQAAPDSNA